MTAGAFLHGTLNGILGISPIFILIQIIVFFHKPGDVLLYAHHVASHQLKQDRIKLFFLCIRKLLFGNFNQISEVWQAETFALTKETSEFFILLI